jgi:hypothetical protein
MMLVLRSKPFAPKNQSVRNRAVLLRRGAGRKPVVARPALNCAELFLKQLKPHLSRRVSKVDESIGHLQLPNRIFFIGH